MFVMTIVGAAIFSPEHKPVSSTRESCGVLFRQNSKVGIILGKHEDIWNIICFSRKDAKLYRCFLKKNKVF
jgi:hypothetical protein